MSIATIGICARRKMLCKRCSGYQISRQNAQSNKLLPCHEKAGKQKTGVLFAIVDKNNNSSHLHRFRIVLRPIRGRLVRATQFPLHHSRNIALFSLAERNMHPAPHLLVFVQNIHFCVPADFDVSFTHHLNDGADVQVDNVFRLLSFSEAASDPWEEDAEVGLVEVLAV